MPGVISDRKISSSYIGKMNKDGVMEWLFHRVHMGRLVNVLIVHVQGLAIRSIHCFPKLVVPNGLFERVTIQRTATRIDYRIMVWYMVNGMVPAPLGQPLPDGPSSQRDHLASLTT